MFAASFSSYPLTFSYVGQAEAPQGKAEVIEAKAAPNFSVRLFVNSQTHLPIMVSWQAPARPAGMPGRGGPGGPPASGEGRGAPGRADGAGAPATPAGAPAAAAPATAGAAPAPGASAQGAPQAPPGPPPPGAPNAGRSDAPPAPVEFRIYYADYRDVDGVQWPFRLRRATGADTTEETTFDRFRINTKIDPKKFEVHK
jgi:hypothetical protein